MEPEPDDDQTIEMVPPRTGQASAPRSRRSQALDCAQPGERLANYVLLRRLGVGGTGVVFEATDTERNLPAAVKVLHSFSPPTLASFKREFRVATGVSHPYLLTPYELGAVGERWFIAMELICGSEFIEYVRPQGASRCDEGRLRDALEQVLDGLEALHAQGLVHCDIKPSNVLVSAQGRVRIADFGLATLRDATRASENDSWLFGSPAYMAPEQAAGETVSPATDLYGLGMMLFEVLTGMLAFEGPSYRILAQKMAFNGPSPATLIPDLPADLVELTRALTVRLPEQRPSLQDVRAALAARPTSSFNRVATPPDALVGRRSELARFEQTLARVREGEGVVLRVHGPSGVGKSALLRACERRARESALVLRGRCHELESIPYKGVDQVIDTLRGHLLSLSKAELEELLPPDFASAAAMFPVLGDVAASGASAQRGDEPSEEDLRTRAYTALSALLSSLSRRTPVVVFLDDAHWGDADGARLLEHLASGPTPLPVLFVFAYRPEETHQSPFLRYFDDASTGVRAGYAQHEIALQPLADADAQDLAERLMPGAGKAARRRIARDAEGVPFLVEQLALHERGGGPTPTRLNDAIAERAIQLGTEAQRLLEVLALAGRPLPESLAAAVAEVEDARPALARLGFHSLVRRTGHGRTIQVATYHDRIRVAVCERLDPEARAALHLRLARLGESRGLLPSGALADHYELAGELALASLHALRSARKAEAALAFDRASDMFARAVRLGSAPALVSEARAGLARCLFRAGRCGEAGEAFLEAARHEQGHQREALQTRAVEAWLACGRMHDALTVLKPLVLAAGSAYPERVIDVVKALVRGISHTRLTLLRKPVVRQQPDAALAHRADVLWAGGKGLLLVAPGEGMALAFESLRWSVAAGDPHRIGRALAFAGSGFPPLLGSAGTRYLAWARELAERYDDDHLRMMIAVGDTARGFLTGAWQDAVQASERVMSLSPRTRAATYWEQASAQTLAVGALEYQGELQAMGKASSAFLREARDRGDHLTAVTLVSGYGYARVAQHDADGLDAVIRSMAREMGGWQLDFGTWDFYALRLRVLRALCWGQRERARTLLDETWPRLRKHQLLRMPIVRLPALKLRQAVLLEQLAHEARPARQLQREVERLNRSLAAESRPDGPAYASAARAALHHLRGDLPRRDAALAGAARLAERADLRVQTRMIARTQAALAGRFDEVARLDDELRTLGVADAPSFARYALPGFAHACAD